MLLAGLPTSVDSNVCVERRLAVVRNCSFIHFTAMAVCVVMRLGVEKDSLSENMVADVISFAIEIEKL